MKRIPFSGNGTGNNKKLIGTGQEEVNCPLWDPITKAVVFKAKVAN